MKHITFQSRLFLLASFFLAVFFDQNYAILFRKGVNSSKLLKLTLGRENFIKHENASKIKVDYLINELGNVVNKISRLKRSLSAQPDIDKCTQEKFVETNNCVKDLLHQVNFGIPSNRHETETACRSFFIAMRCMGEWAKICLSETAANNFSDYVAPAAEAYSNICKDNKSRAKFYRHGECFRKISPGFDACVDEMGAKLNALQEDKHSIQICCHQRNFLKCVSQVLIQNECSMMASQAMMETAERTLQFHPDQVVKKNNTKGICVRMTNDQCVELSKNSKTTLPSSSTHRSFSYIPISRIVFGLVLNQIV